MDLLLKKYIYRNYEIRSENRDAFFAEYPEFTSGVNSNIGVIARKAEYLPWIRAALTEANVSDYMQHVLDPEKSKVIRYELPAMNALNFILENVSLNFSMNGSSDNK